MSPPNDNDADNRKLDDLGRRLNDLERRAEISGALPRKNVDPSPRNVAMGTAFKLATEFVAAVGVGGFIGWFLDRSIGTGPILFLVFLALGIAAGFWGVFRTAWQMQRAVEAEQKRAPSVRGDEDEG